MARFFSRRSGVSMVPSSLHAVSRTSTIRRRCVHYGIGRDGNVCVYEGAHTVCLPDVSSMRCGSISSVRCRWFRLGFLRRGLLIVEPRTYSPTAFTLRNAIVCREAVIMISIGVAFPGFPCTTTSSISSESSSTGTYVTLLKSSMMTAFDKGMNLASYAGRFGDVHVMRTQSTCPSTGYRHVTRSSGRCVHSFLRICHMSKANVGTARTLTSVWSASPICSSFLRRVGRFVYLLSASLRRRGKDPKRSTFEDGA